MEQFFPLTFLTILVHCASAFTSTKENSRKWVLFLTSARGMGVNAPWVEYPPSNIEAYMQETGNAGRTGIPSQGTFHYNADIVNNKKQSKLTADIKKSTRRVYKLALPPKQKFHGLQRVQMAAMGAVLQFIEVLKYYNFWNIQQFGRHFHQFSVVS